MGNAWGKVQLWPRRGRSRIRPAVEKACSRVPPCAGHASAPLPVKLPHRSCLSCLIPEERSPVAGSTMTPSIPHPGLDPATRHQPGSTTTPPVGRFMRNLIQKAAYWLLHTSSPSQESGLTPPPHHVPLVHPCCRRSCTHSRLQGQGVLLFPAACCATAGCTSCKHPAACGAPATLHPLRRRQIGPSERCACLGQGVTAALGCEELRWSPK